MGDDKPKTFPEEFNETFRKNLDGDVTRGQVISWLSSNIDQLGEVIDAAGSVQKTGTMLANWIKSTIRNESASALASPSYVASHLDDGVKLYWTSDDSHRILQSAGARSTLLVVSDKPLWDHESKLSYWTDGDKTAIQEYFPEPSQAQAIADACTLLEEVEDVFRGERESKRYWPEKKQ